MFPNHCFHLLEQLNIQRYYGNLCDITIRVDGTDFKSHRCILAASSAKLQSAILTVHGDVLALKSVTSYGIQVALDFIYTGNIHFAPHMLADVMETSRHLGLTDLESACLKFTSFKTECDQTQESTNAMPDLAPIAGDKNSRIGLCDTDGYISTTPRPEQVNDDKNGNYLNSFFTELQSISRRRKPLEGCSKSSLRRENVRSMADIYSRQGWLGSRNSTTDCKHNTSFDQSIPNLMRIDNKFQLDNEQYCCAGNTDPKSTMNGYCSENRITSEEIDLLLPISHKLDNETDKIFDSPSCNNESYSKLLLSPFDGNELSADVLRIELDQAANECPVEAESNGHVRNLRPKKLSDCKKTYKKTKIKCPHKRKHQPLVSRICHDTLTVDSFVLIKEPKVEARGNLETGSIPGTVSIKRRKKRIKREQPDGKRKDFVCDRCSASFCRSCELTRHKRNHIEQTHRCHHCPLVFPTCVAFKQHNKSLHNERNAFYCPHLKCNFCTNKLSNLEIHSEIHSEVKLYTCPYCGRSFAQDNGLRSHLLSCAKMRSYLCDLCGAKFNHLQGMQSHRRIHTGEKPHKCTDCESQFSDHRNLKRHRRIHENIFPYSCPICAKSFRHSNSLKTHVGSHKVAQLR